MVGLKSFWLMSALSREQKAHRGLAGDEYLTSIESYPELAGMSSVTKHTCHGLAVYLKSRVSPEGRRNRE
jgi:hypothetical protein